MPRLRPGHFYLLLERAFFVCPVSCNRWPSKIIFLPMDLEEQHRPLVVHNEANHRFEVALRDEWAFLEYRVDNDTIALFHTEVPAQFQNQGIGNDLVTAA